MQIDVEPQSFNIDAAIPIGLIINELVSNALKYAFPPPPSLEPSKQRSILVSIRRNGGDLTNVSVRDNGIGFPGTIDFSNTDSLGMQLVVTLTKQLQGAIRLEREEGTAFIITFPAT